jgi:hypothetical protein
MIIEPPVGALAKKINVLFGQHWDRLAQCAIGISGVARLIKALQWNREPSRLRQVRCVVYHNRIMSIKLSPSLPFIV